MCTYALLMSDCKNLVSYADSSNISPCIGHQRNYKQKMIANYDGVMGEGLAVRALRGTHDTRNLRGGYPQSSNLGITYT